MQTNTNDAQQSSPSLADRARSLLRNAVLQIPIPVGVSKRAAQAQEYWSTPSQERWAADSHFRNSDLPEGSWERIGRTHLGYYNEFARAQEISEPGRVLEWGAGGGANAVAFAPVAKEFIAVDISPESLQECERQVRKVCETPFQAALVSADSPEDAMAIVDGTVDLFLCFYVMELLPSQVHARRVLNVAAHLLRPGGTAIIQIKYQTGSPLTRSRTWSYQRQIASMTSFHLDQFWKIAASSGFTPEWIKLVPKNELDDRYGYFFLTRN